jgi:hypothetical protein
MKYIKEVEKIKPQTVKVVPLKEIIKKQAILKSINKVSTLIEKQKK